MLTRSGLLSAQLRVTIPDAADVVATVANVTLPLEALVALPSMIFGSALRFTEPPPNMWLLDAPSNALILTNMSTTNDYVAYRPVLCAEVEQG